MMTKRLGDHKVPHSSRLVGVLPLGFFLWRLIEYVWVGTPSHALWNCHIANVLLAFGLFFSAPLLIRISVLWLILGVPPWLYDMYIIRIFTPAAFLSHLGGCAVAWWAISRLGVTGRIWPVALLAHVVWQQVSRLTTPEIYNVNLAHTIYPGFEQYFTAYWQYWLALTAVIGFWLAAIEWALGRLFPPPRPWTAGGETAEITEERHGIHEK